jgi:hypothetical protein
MFIPRSKNDEMIFITLTLSLFSTARLIFFPNSFIKHRKVIIFFLDFLVLVNVLRLYDTILNFVENLLENERGPMNDQSLTKTDYDPDRSGPMNDQSLTKTDYDPDRSLVLIEGLSHFLTNFLQNLASCQTSFRHH